MKPTRRTFLGLLAGAVAAGFAKVETAVLERPGPLVSEAFYGAGVGGGKTEALFHLWGKPVYECADLPANRLMSVNFDDFYRYQATLSCAAPRQNAVLIADEPEGPSGDPTSRE